MVHALTPPAALLMYVQVWQQFLRERKPENGEVRGFLSSYDVTTFLVRRKTTLYMTGNYEWDSEKLLMATYCMVARSLNLTSAGLDLPDVNTAWWPPAVAQSTFVGVDRAS